MGLLSRENRRAWRGLRQLLSLRAGTLVCETEHAGGHVSHVKKPLRHATLWSTAAPLRRTDMGGRRITTCQPSDLRTIDAFFQVCGGTADFFGCECGSLSLPLANNRVFRQRCVSWSSVRNTSQRPSAEGRGCVMRPQVFAIALQGREATLRAQTAAGHPVWGRHLARDRRLHHHSLGH
jgi:hypothetical protein